VVPLPVAATVFDSLMKRGLVVAASVTETSAEQVMLVRPVVLRVTLIVRVIVPVNVAAAGASRLSSATAGTGRNASV